MIANTTLIPISALRRGPSFKQADYERVKAAVQASHGKATAWIHPGFSLCFVYGQVKIPEPPKPPIGRLAAFNIHAFTALYKPLAEYHAHLEVVRQRIQSLDLPLFLFIQKELLETAKGLLEELDPCPSLLVHVPTKWQSPAPDWETNTTDAEDFQTLSTVLSDLGVVNLGLMGELAYADQNGIPKGCVDGAKENLTSLGFEIQMLAGLTFPDINFKETPEARIKRRI